MSVYIRNNIEFDESKSEEVCRLNSPSMMSPWGILYKSAKGTFWTIYGAFGCGNNVDIRILTAEEAKEYVAKNCPYTFKKMYGQPEEI